MTSHEQFYEESIALEDCQGENIVVYRDHFILHNNTYLITDKYDGCLRGAFHLRIDCRPVISVVSFIKQLFTAVFRVHSCGYIHRDIKPENLMVKLSQINYAQRKRIHVKDFFLGDFGAAKQIKSLQKSCESPAGTPHYIAPEVWLDGFYSEAADIYSIGVTLYEVLFGCLPIDINRMGAWAGLSTNQIMDMSQAQIVKAIISCMKQRNAFFFVPSALKPGHQAFLLDSDGVLGSQIQSLIASCLSLHPHERPTASDVLALPWVGGIVHQNTPIASPGGGVSMAHSPHTAANSSSNEELLNKLVQLLLQAQQQQQQQNNLVTNNNNNSVNNKECSHQVPPTSLHQNLALLPQDQSQHWSQLRPNSNGYGSPVQTSCSASAYNKHQHNFALHNNQNNNNNATVNNIFDVNGHCMLNKSIGLQIGPKDNMKPGISQTLHALPMASTICFPSNSQDVAVEKMSVKINREQHFIDNKVCTRNLDIKNNIANSENYGGADHSDTTIYDPINVTDYTCVSPSIIERFVATADCPSLLSAKLLKTRDLKQTQMSHNMSTICDLLSTSNTDLPSNKETNCLKQPIFSKLHTQNNELTKKEEEEKEKSYNLVDDATVEEYNEENVYIIDEKTTSTFPIIQEANDYQEGGNGNECESSVFIKAVLEQEVELQLLTEDILIVDNVASVAIEEEVEVKDILIKNDHLKTLTYDCDPNIDNPRCLDTHFHNINVTPSEHNYAQIVKFFETNEIDSTQEATSCTTKLNLDESFDQPNNKTLICCSKSKAIVTSPSSIHHHALSSTPSTRPPSKSSPCGETNSPFNKENPCLGYESHATTVLLDDHSTIPCNCSVNAAKKISLNPPPTLQSLL